MPIRLCLNAGCPNPATYRGKCPTHAKAREQGTRRAGHHIYGTKRWQLLRRRVLSEQPLCAADGCDEIATDADHIVPIEQGGPPYKRAVRCGRGERPSHSTARSSATY